MHATIHADKLRPIDWADMFAAIWPRHTRKLLANAAGISERRAKYLIEGKASPTADEMFVLSLQVPGLQRELWRAWMSAKRGDADRLARESHRLDVVDAEDGV